MQADFHVHCCGQYNAQRKMLEMNGKLRNERFIKIGLNISYYRRLRGLSQEQLAEAADISRQWLAQVEAPGLVSPLSIETLFCIADALGVEPAVLLDFSR